MLAEVCNDVGGYFWYPAQGSLACLSCHAYGSLALSYDIRQKQPSGMVLWIWNNIINFTVIMQTQWIPGAECYLTSQENVYAWLLV